MTTGPDDPLDGSRGSAGQREQELRELLRAATVLITVAGAAAGAGVVVGPRLVLSCAHVTGRSGAAVNVVPATGAAVAGRVREAWPEPSDDEPAGDELTDQEPADADPEVHGTPDLALIELDAALSCPYAQLDPGWPLAGDRLEAAGLTRTVQRDAISPETGVFGYAGDLYTTDEKVRLIKLGGERAEAGMSGGPVLNHRTGRVVGLVRTNRSHRYPLGAWAVPVGLALAHWPDLAAEHDRQHAVDDRWRRTAEDWAGLAAALFVPPRDWEADQPLPPGAALVPEYELVPFRHRDQERTELATWCQKPAQFGLLLITGPAGQGKTRLARQVCTERGPGWLAGILRSRSDQDGQSPAVRTDDAGRPVALGDDLTTALTRCTAPVLMVLDYAEAQPELVADCTRVLRRRTAPGRLLLLARGAGDWLDQLRAFADDTLAWWLSRSPLPLGELTPNDRREEYQYALTAFADRLGHPTAEVPVPANLDEEHLDRVLDIHAAALAALLDQTDAAGGGSAGLGPVDRVLAHEQRYWLHTATAAALPSPHPDRLAAVTAAGTLLGPLADGTAAAVLARLPTFRGVEPDTIDRYVRWSHGLGGTQPGIYQLRPDRLGEDHTARTLLRHPDLGLALLGLADQGQAEHALTVLGRASGRHPDLPALLIRLIAGPSDALLAAALRVIPQLQDPHHLSAAVESALRAHPPGAEQAERLAALLPHPSQALIRIAVVLAEITVDHYRGQGTNADLAGALNDLSVRLGDAGQEEKGRDAVQEAHTIYQALAKRNADAHQLGRARALNNLSIRLAETGRREEGLAASQEAVAIGRAGAERDRDAWLPDLAGWLNNLSLHLAEAGQVEAALAAIEEALTVYDILVKREPGVWLPKQADAFITLSGRLSAAGRHETALTIIKGAVKISRILVEERPDTWQPTLAAALHNLAIRLGEAGRRDEALAASQEAMALYRTFAENNPAAWQPGLEKSLAMAAWLRAL